jgi:hypothetical protein
VVGRPASRGILFISLKDTFNDSESKSKVKQTVTTAVVVAVSVMMCGWMSQC